jgi:hypothetical protein
VTASGLIWGGGCRLIDLMTVETNGLIWGGGN